MCTIGMDRARAPGSCLNSESMWEGSGGVSALSMNTPSSIRKGSSFGYPRAVSCRVAAASCGAVGYIGRSHMRRLDTIRRLGSDDAPAWASLRSEALQTHPLAFGASVPDDPALLVETALGRLSAAESVIFGAFVGGQLVGIAGLLREQGRKERHKCYVWGMYVDPSFRRLGAGRLLLDAAIDQARAWHGVEQIGLSVSTVAVEARSMYEARGFRAWGVEPRALCWEGRYADEIHMTLNLRGSDVG